MPPSPPSKRLQLVFLATGAFAVPSMREICDADEFDVVCLVTKPLRFTKSGQPILMPARRFAEERGLVVFEIENVNSREFSDFLYLVRPDLLFVCDFGQILSAQTLQGAILGGANLHGSLLPLYRGAAPVHWAVLKGEEYTGVSIIHMTPAIDAGPVIAQSPPIAIGPHETAAQLEERLAEYGADLVLHTIRKMAGPQTVDILEQRSKHISKAPRLKKEDGLVDWNTSSRDIYNHYRAMAEWPKSFTDWTRPDGKSTRLILGDLLPLNDRLRELIDNDYAAPEFVPPPMVDAKRVNLYDLFIPAERKLRQNEDLDEPNPCPAVDRPAWWLPGTVVKAVGDDLIIAAGLGTIRLLKVQPAGKRMMDVRDFLRGYPIKPGDRLA